MNEGTNKKVKRGYTDLQGIQMKQKVNSLKIVVSFL